MKFSILAPLVGFLLPWQTRFIFRAPEIGGVAWDFGVVSLFISQIAIVLWIIITLWSERVAVRTWFIEWSTKKIIIAELAVGLCIAQLTVSSDRVLTLQWLVGFSLLVGLAFVLRQNPHARIPFAAACLISVVLQALLAALQVFAGATFASSLLGVAAHKAATAGSAIVEYGDQRYLRAYGGQPHPNIFGGLALAATALFGWLLHNKHTLGVKKNIIYFSLIVTGALFFSFSRAAWLGFVIWLIVLWWQRLQLRESQVTQLKYAALTFGILTVLFFPMVSTRVAPSATAQTEQRSVAERIAGFSQFKSVMRDHWFAGTGLGAYTTRLFGATGDTRTPVHAAPLLVFAELGLFGVALIVTIAWLSRMRISTRTVLLALIPIALFDHYLFSLWSGQVVLFLMLFQMFQIRDNDKADDNQQ